jgi:hypothetical protein
MGFGHAYVDGKAEYLSYSTASKLGGNRVWSGCKSVWKCCKNQKKNCGKRMVNGLVLVRVRKP